MTRMGGGFGRRLYGHFMLEAAVISKKVKSPIKLIYTREDDMTSGTYRPSYHVRYKAAVDKNNNVTAFHVRAGGVPESCLYANRFPAGAIENYLAEKNKSIELNLGYYSYSDYEPMAFWGNNKKLKKITIDIINELDIILDIDIKY